MPELVSFRHMVGIFKKDFTKTDKYKKLVKSADVRIILHKRAT